MDKSERRWGVARIAAVFGTVGAVFVAFCFFFYPGVTLARLAADTGIHTDGQPTQLPAWFKHTARRYQTWANDYLASRRAEQVSSLDVAGTEWPLFGTVFFLGSTEELLRDGKLELDAELRAALDVAARVVVDPSTASWVRSKWGDGYLDSENVFYRMLVILGLTSFEQITLDTRYRAFAQHQARSLATELMAAKYHLADDYPGECYPTDVLWAVAAIKRALGAEAEPLARELLQVLDGPIRTPHGVPAFSVDSKTAAHFEGSRGSGNSGLLCFASELDPHIAQRWYASFAEHHWVDGMVSGFREVPRGAAQVMNVDSGPVIGGMGSVASLFGIGAARASGRFDHAAPLSLQVVAISWPSPFGLLIPGAMGFLAADGWCLGELALSFAMTRRTHAVNTTAHDGSVPLLVWVMLGFYFGVGTLILAREIRYWRVALGRQRDGAQITAKRPTT